jgi:broad specificity phosphatase PhoE
MMRAVPPAGCPASYRCGAGRWQRSWAAAAAATRSPPCSALTCGHLDAPYPGGESWRQAVTRVGRFLADLPSRWDEQRVLVIGHVATRWGLDHHINGVALEDLAGQDFAWREGWEYRLR